MKKNGYGYLLLVLLVFTSLTARSQADKTLPKDSSLHFTVYGACIQCKERIESVLKIKGVRSAVWDINSKQLSLVYNPGLVSLNKIENRIVAAGHDLVNKKAKLSVYSNLPQCCHYREMDNKNIADTTIVLPAKTTNTVNTPGFQSKEPYIKGVVLESNKKGIFNPLAGASIIWLGSVTGTTSDSSGAFTIRNEPGMSRLIVSYTGYAADTLTVTDIKELKIILATNKKLAEVIVTAKQRSTYLLAINPIRTQVMTGKELFKAACCNLSESFETNPSVDVSYNDAITGSKQIQLLGLSGNYTQLTVENLPGPRGLATAFGLNSIAGPWIESIQLTKGIGSVANGYESIAGQINIELKKPGNSERFFANAYINDYGKTDLNLNLSQKIGKKWSVGLLLHDDFLANKKLDANKDGFRDLPTGNQFNLMNRWKYDNSKGFLIQLAVKILADRKTGGETAFNAGSDKNTTRHYGLGVNTLSYNGFVKIGFVFPEKKYKSIGLQLAAFDHAQDSYYGLTNYTAKQQNFYSNLIYQSIINNTNHKFRAGLSFVYDKYNEDIRLQHYKRTEIVPGAFFEYTYTHTDKFSMVAGLRADHNNLFGFSMTPRLHIRYEPVKGTTIRLSAGRGQRTANIFAENNSVLASSRQVNIINAIPGKAYGLDPEVAWNKGISIDQKFKLFHRDGLLSLDFFRNDFTKQVVVDLEDAGQVKFYNLQGRSYSNSFQTELNVEPFERLELRLAYRYFDVKTNFTGQVLQRPLIANNRAFINLAYAIQGWKFDYTINYIGSKRIPGTAGNPLPYQRETHSPGFVLMNAQVSKTIGKKHPMDIYIGGENLGNYYQQLAIIAADQPFSPYFDASLIWGPITGRMFYAGWRFKLK